MIRLAATLVVLCGLQAADEENRDYKGWSSCKAGSWTKLTMEMSKDGHPMSMGVTKTLKSIDEKEAVVELKMSVNAGGRTMDMPGHDEHIPAKGPGRFQQPKEAKDRAEGDEEIELGGRKVQCHWFKCTVEMEKWKGTAKVWLSAEIPGGLAKMESTSDDEKAPSMKMTVTSWEKK